jgi:hypothetical protein
MGVSLSAPPHIGEYVFQQFEFLDNEPYLQSIGACCRGIQIAPLCLGLTPKCDPHPLTLGQ